MASLWSKIRAILPPGEQDFPLEFSDRVEASVVEVLRWCRRLLYQEATGSSRMLQAQIVLDYSWEKLNAGTWRHVDKDWRRVYSYGCLFKVAALCCRRRHPTEDDVLQAVRTCDMALLMGAAILDDILQMIVQILQREVRQPTNDGDEAGRSEVKVGGLFLPLASCAGPFSGVHECFLVTLFSFRRLRPTAEERPGWRFNSDSSVCLKLLHHAGSDPRLHLKRPSISAGACRITAPWNSSSL